MRKAALTIVIFLTFFSGSPQEPVRTGDIVPYVEQQEVIIKLQELDSLIISANKLLDEKGI